jgi:3'-phosphoadenosine 5'-phosphosulfate (PAPS) 3'-phosphatase
MMSKAEPSWVSGALAACPARGGSRIEECVMKATDARLADELTAIISRAAGKVMAFDPASIARRTKSDLSPVTAADEIANEIILEGVSRLLPGMRVISEESAGSWMSIEFAADFILVDPLDGTREFLEGRGDFTLNIAFVRDRQPSLGVIMAPASGTVWRGVTGGGPSACGSPQAGPSLSYRMRPASARGLVLQVVSWRR